jgi:hypothetical protein
MSLWRALEQGIGWRVGREIAEDLITGAKREPEKPPEETPEARDRRIAAALAQAEKRAKEAAKAKERDRKEVDRELAQLKKDLGRK